MLLTSLAERDVVCRCTSRHGSGSSSSSSSSEKPAAAAVVTAVHQLRDPSKPTPRASKTTVIAVKRNVRFRRTYDRDVCYVTKQNELGLMWQISQSCLQVV
jgi:hypothetical protein